ncbi:hypothetical protein A6R68_05843, partial [Neotoma lepida]
ASQPSQVHSERFMSLHEWPQMLLLLALHSNSTPCMDYAKAMLSNNAPILCGSSCCRSGDSPLEDDGVWYSHSLYKDTPWCSPIKVKYGDVYCRAPPGGYYKTALGTRCDIRCRKGYELHGSSQLICQSNKRWSDKVICKQKRCPTLAMPANGGFKCVDGAYFNSRCEYYCSPGYTLKGERTVTCMDNKAWSGRPASCVGKKMSQTSGVTPWERSSRSLLV